MATGRQGRQDRLNERLRGAQRVNVEDDTFHLDIAGITQPLGAGAQQASSTPPSARPSRRLPARSSSARQSSDIQPPENEAGPQPETVQPRRRSRQVPSSSPRIPPRTDEEEITESPAHAPGSGHRRPVPVNSTADAAAKLRGAVASDDTNPISSSPLARKTRRSETAASERAARSPIPEDPDQSDSDIDQVSVPPPRQANRPRVPQRRQSPSESPEEEPAEEISDDAAARQLGQKRPRQSFQPSPELGSEESDNQEPDEPAPKRQARQRKAPVTQRQPTKRRNPAEGKPKKKKAPKARGTGSRARAGSADDAPIEITVQKFVNAEGEEGSDEEGGSEIPFANRSGETVVDVLAQVCEEVIGATLGQLEHLAHNTTDPAKRKESRIKMRAVEAYREEVSARLLQHAIHLNHWHSLRKRLRHVQKEKLELRQEILRLKGEKEQVALRMDATRVHSEKQNNDAKHRLNASDIMNDVEVAVEQGRDAAQLSERATKDAEIPNLELLISQISETASSNSFTGGLLNQLRDFNTFLERAAYALESK